MTHALTLIQTKNPTPTPNPTTSTPSPWLTQNPPQTDDNDDVNRSEGLFGDEGSLQLVQQRLPRAHGGPVHGSGASLSSRKW